MWEELKMTDMEKWTGAGTKMITSNATFALAYELFTEIWYMVIFFSHKKFQK